MNEGAISAPELGGRERKRLQTYAALIHHARTLTAERGLAGFTVDELAEQVGVSRRTFFNYFNSKEDAVLGVKPIDPLEPFAQGFVDSGSVEPAVPLRQALTTLILQGFSTMEEVPRAHLRMFMTIMREEPALLRRMLQATREREHELAGLIARREGLPPGDPFAEDVAAFVAHLMKRSFDRFFGHPDDGVELPEDVDETSEQARERFTDLLHETFENAARFFRA